ncbi:ATP-binding protein [Epilithonimonas xixisoli]|uniref:histidine kinase n=1 Tax=Epilithonimonas xixisoli TaxID=1476462 RepID=A0A4R8I9F0_9FLAO|nr:ATP-binding protein [Epilithonimonas xixisoli]TDX83282.1 light-regulated signal transduction histidine kinase (bacteriophytochrome) [Epilithonimonas xixisoli]
MYPKEYINCDQEHIHIIGEVQEYGFLIGTKGSEIAFYSENVLSLFSLKPKSVLGEKIEVLFDQLKLDINWENFSHNQELAIQHINFNGEEYTLSIHSNNGFTLYEIEKVFPHHKINKEYQAVQNILRKSNDENIWKILLKEIQEIIDFDRAMIYQFLYDGSGEVIEESVKPGLESYLHLHYPESDIPAQARALYLKNTVRITSHVSGKTYPIVGVEKDSIDLTYSVTRSSSPVHRQYLKNAGVESSFSTSIIVNGQLWGLVACQNAAPKHLDLQSRLLVETLTRTSANTFSSYKALETLEEYQRVNLHNIELRQNLLNEENFAKALQNNIQDVMNTCNADGMIIKINNEILTAGNVPNHSDIENIIHWSKENNQNFEENIFISNTFCKDIDKELENPETVCGIIISVLGNNSSDMLIWLRKEQGQKIKWAGKPEKGIISEIKNGVEIIKFSPRKSFEVWKEYVKGTSLPWKIKEIESAKWLTSIILKASHTKSSQIIDLNNQLNELNQELDSFSYTISHDLNTPLTVIKLNAQLMKRIIKPEDNTNKYLDNIVNQVDTMSDMIKNVLELSKIKKSEIELKKIEVDLLINKLAEDSKVSFDAPHTEIIIENTPEVLGDPTMVYQVFGNVIGNAIKYSSKSSNPTVKIIGEVFNNEVTYKITDNGIGIDKKDADKMFKIFSRMSNAKAFNGNGVGLNIVQHLMEKMGGAISYESESGVGTTFILKFQKPDYDFSIS